MVSCTLRSVEKHDKNINLPHLQDVHIGRDHWSDIRNSALSRKQSNYEQIK